MTQQADHDLWERAMLAYLAAGEDPDSAVMAARRAVVRFRAEQAEDRRLRRVEGGDEAANQIRLKDERIGNLLSGLREMARTEHHAGKLCAHCKGRPGRASQLYDMIRELLSNNKPPEDRDGHDSLAADCAAAAARAERLDAARLRWVQRLREIAGYDTRNGASRAALALADEMEGIQL